MKVEDIKLAFENNQKFELSLINDLMTVDEGLELAYIDFVTLQKKADAAKTDLKNEKTKAISVLGKFKASAGELGFDATKNVFYSSTQKMLQNNIIKGL